MSQPYQINALLLRITAVDRCRLVSGSVCRRAYLSFPHHVAGGKMCMNAVTFSSGRVIQV